MKHAKHTPGPWIVETYDNGQFFIVDRTETMVLAECNKSSSQANARLISAAPILLEALLDAKQNIKQLCDHVNALKGAKVRFDDFAENIERAIAKATGGAE